MAGGVMGQISKVGTLSPLVYRAPYMNNNKKGRKVSKGFCSINYHHYFPYYQRGSNIIRAVVNVVPLAASFLLTLVTFKDFISCFTVALLH